MIGMKGKTNAPEDPNSTPSPDHVASSSHYFFFDRLYRFIEEAVSSFITASPVTTLSSPLVRHLCCVPEVRLSSDAIDGHYVLIEYRSTNRSPNSSRARMLLALPFLGIALCRMCKGYLFANSRLDVGFVQPPSIYPVSLR